MRGPPARRTRFYPWRLGRWHFWLITGVPWHLRYFRVRSRFAPTMHVLELGPVALEWRRF